LAAHGAAKVSAYVTHGVFPKRSWERFTHKDNGKGQRVIRHTLLFCSCIYFCWSFLTLSQMMIVPFFSGMENAFAYFWITDSCPHTVKAITNKPPFEVLSLAGSIADALQI